MKVIQGDEIPLERGLEHRGGAFHFRRVLEGAAGQVDNFQLSFGQMSGEFYSPRHRHNFEQIRYQFQDELDFGRDGKLKAGMVGYFPEGAAYGPQSQDPSHTPKTAVLQFGGASGGGYLSRNEVKAGMDELKNIGMFKDGVFTRTKEDGGKINTDAYQAIWEHARGIPMTYPKPRYPAPIFMDPASFDWVPTKIADGVWEKTLGVFSERGTTVRLVKLDAGSSYMVAGNGVYVVLRGQGHVGSDPLRQQTAIYLKIGEACEVSADREAELLFFGLPDLGDLGRRAGEGGLANAAE